MLSKALDKATTKIQAAANVKQQQVPSMHPGKNSPFSSRLFITICDIADSKKTAGATTS